MMAIAIQKSLVEGGANLIFLDGEIGDWIISRMKWSLRGMRPGKYGK
jgi:hypothetical protein